MNMDRIIYIFKIGLISFLIICTFRYIFSYPESTLGIIIYSFCLGISVSIVSLFLLNSPPKRKK